MEQETVNEIIDSPGVKTLGVLIACVVVVFLTSKLIGLEHIIFVSIKQYANSLHQLTQQHQLIASLLFFLVFLFCAVLFIPIKAVLSVVAGFLFGTLWGTILVTVSVVIGSLIVVLEVRMLYAKRVKKRYSHTIQTFAYEMKQYGGRYIVGLHLLPFTPMFLINIAAGALAVSVWTLVWATALGTLPGTIIYVIAGKSLRTLSTVHDLVGTWALLGMTMMGIMVLASRFFLPARNASNAQSKSQ